MEGKETTQNMSQVLPSQNLLPNIGDSVEENRSAEVRAADRQVR